jgi:hypothetical protein
MYQHLFLLVVIGNVSGQRMVARSLGVGTWEAGLLGSLWGAVGRGTVYQRPGCHAAVRMGGEKNPGGHLSANLQSLLPHFVFPAISPIPGAFQDSGKTAGLGKSNMHSQENSVGMCVWAG